MPITNAQLAQQILDMVDARIQFDLEHHEWLTGVVGGGDFADGKYLLTNPITLVSRYTTSPAQLEDDVNGLVNSASTFSTDAQNAATAAGISETNAAASAASALSEKNLAVAEKVSAQNAQSAAENAAVNALAQANNAATSYDQFDDRYLGVFTTALEPTVDNDGDALLTGAIYWNSDLSKFKVWTGSAWALSFDLSEADNFTWTGLHTFDQYLSLTPMAAPAYTEGRLWYDSAAKALSYYNDEADVTINLGQETVVRARNVTGVLIPNGSAVYVSGATGASLPNIALAQADSSATAEVLGIVTHDIENNSNGYVTVVGDVNDLDTSAWAAGAELFLSDSVAGGLTDTKPTLNDVRVGYVTVSNVSVGSIKVQVGLPVNHNHPASEITSGTLADARIAASNVTQHQAALSITESQISDLGSYLPLAGGTVTGRLIAGYVNDVSLAGVSGSLIIGGDGTSTHIAIDNNEIMAKASATTSSALNLQVEGGTVACGGPLTATAITEGGTSLASKYLGISAQAADSALLGGIAKSTSATSNTVVERASGGYVYATFFNASGGDTATTASHYVVETGSDGFYRQKTLANVRNEIVTATAVNAAATEASTVSTAVKRNASGDINCRLLRSEYDTTNGTINYIMTQIDTASNNYVRPSTPAQLRASVNAGYLGAEPYTVSTADPSGGGDGDFWFKREV